MTSLAICMDCETRRDVSAKLRALHRRLKCDFCRRLAWHRIYSEEQISAAFDYTLELVNKLGVVVRWIDKEDELATDLAWVQATLDVDGSTYGARATYVARIHPDVAPHWRLEGLRWIYRQLSATLEATYCDGASMALENAASYRSGRDGMRFHCTARKLDAAGCPRPTRRSQTRSTA